MDQASAIPPPGDQTVWIDASSFLSDVCDSKSARTSVGSLSCFFWSILSSPFASTLPFRCVRWPLLRIRLSPLRAGVSESYGIHPLLPPSLIRHCRPLLPRNPHLNVAQLPHLSAVYLGIYCLFPLLKLLLFVHTFKATNREIDERLRLNVFRVSPMILFPASRMIPFMKVTIFSSSKVLVHIKVADDCM
jgi:hypothetical protein